MKVTIKNLIFPCAVSSYYSEIQNYYRIFSDSKNALKVAENLEGGFSTCGVHPTRCSEFDQSGDAEQYYKNLRDFANSSDKIKAIGECGLDYDRLHFCPAETQKVWFERQLKLSAEVGKPLFLHMRAAAKDGFFILTIYLKTKVKVLEISRRVTLLKYFVSH